MKIICLITLGRGKEVLGIVHLSFKVRRPRKGIRDTKRVVVISRLYSDGLALLPVILTIPMTSEVPPTIPHRIT